MFYAKTNNNLLSLLPIILIFYFVHIYLKIIIDVLKDNFYKIYLYLYQYNICYNILYKVWNFYNDTLGCTRYPFFNLYCYLKILKENPHTNLFNRYDEANSYKRILIHIAIIINKNPRLTTIFNKTRLASSLIIEEIIFKYKLYIFIFMVLLYDLQYNNIKYLYYALFIYLLITLFNKVIKFIGETDMHDIDDKLVKYYYKERIHDQLRNAICKEDTSII